MIGYLTLILFCQLIGEIATKVTNLPVPGPVVGMVILFSWLTIRRNVPVELESVSSFLHRYLPLLFVPAGVGVIANFDLLLSSLAPFAGAILIGTAVTIGVSGVIMQQLLKRYATDQGELRP